MGMIGRDTCLVLLLCRISSVLGKVVDRSSGFHYIISEHYPYDTG